MVATIAGLVAAATLIVAATGHLVRPGVLAADLRRQRLLPGAVAHVVALALPVTELVLGVAAAAEVLGRATGVGPVTPLLAAAALYTAFAVYATVLLRRPGGRRAPCGCAATSTAVTPLVPARAAALALMALLGLAGGPLPADAGMDARLVLLLSAATFTTLLWIAPSALSTMADRPTGGDATDVVHG